MSYQKRLDALNKSWESDKAATGFQQLPPGKYQFEIKKAIPTEGKSDFNKGHLVIRMDFQVVTGSLKGRKAAKFIDLEQPANKEKSLPSGMSMFKGCLESLKVDMPKNLTDKSIKKVLEQLIGIVFNGTCVHNKSGYANIYINDLVNAASSNDEEEDDDEDETEEEEVKKPSKNGQEKDSEEDEEDDDDEDDDEEDDDEEEEEKPAKKSSTQPVDFNKKAEKKAKKEDDDEWGD